MLMGREAVTVLRELLAAKTGVGHYLTDLRFATHLTVVRSSELTEDMKSGIKAAIGAVQPCVASIKSLSIRPRKVDKILPEPVLVLDMKQN